MAVLRLAICVSGVYATFLLWAIAQERLSKPFPRSFGIAGSAKEDKFPSPLFLNFAQSLASGFSAIFYLLIKSWISGNDKQDLKTILGLDRLSISLGRRSSVAEEKVGGTGATGRHNGHSLDRPREGGSANGDMKVSYKEEDEKEERRKISPSPTLIPPTRTLPSLLFQVSLCQTLAGPIGFLALRHISFPTMVLGKSCKLIPVMLLNVLLYRRRFSTHKYVVVTLVTFGISLFMLLAPSEKKGGSDDVWGMTLLLINLLIDGMTNSTQDQIFTQYPTYAGQQLMAHMAIISQLLLLPALLLPLPSYPGAILSYLPSPISGGSAIRLHPSFDFSPPAFFTSLAFLRTHPTALPPLLAYALLGGLGQLFIFETIAHFGSLTLVMVTVTRKLFTMLLSVLVFEHNLGFGQWVAVAIVFAGIGLEAGMKRGDGTKKARRDKNH